LNSISIVIPTKNREKDLLYNINSILEQSILPQELIIIDQSTQIDSEVAIKNIFSSLPTGKRNKINLKYIYSPEIPGLTFARNIGIEKSSKDIVLFLDDDVLLERDFIANILNTYQKYPFVGGVGGVITNYRKSYLNKLFFKIFYLGPFKDERQEIYWNADINKGTQVVKVSKLGGGLMSFRRELLKNIKFDENYRGYSFGEDFEFCYRFSRKYKLFINTKARLYHKSSNNKYNLKQHTMAHVWGYYYFFSQVLDKNLWNCLCFFWLNIGFLGNAFIKLLKTKNMEALLGIFFGYLKIYNYIFNNYKKRI